MLIFAERLDGKAGGPSTSIPEFSKTLNKSGLKNNVFCRSEYLQDYSNTNFIKVIPYNSPLSLLLILVRHLKRVSKEERIIHINFIWRIEIIVIIIAGLFYRSKIVVNPRGMLNKKAYSSGSLLKIPFFHLIVRPLLLLGVNYLQCSSQEEVQALKKYFPKKNVFLNTLGYKRLKEKKEANTEEKLEAKTIVSISRIDSHKKIDFMISEFIRSGLGRAGWKLNLYGANELSDYQACVKNFTSNDLFENQISLNLFVNQQEKIEILSESSFFISTSSSESFGLSIAESLDIGTPIIIRNNTIWEKYVLNKCGFSFEEENIAYIFNKLLTLDVNSYKELVGNIKEHYSPVSWSEHAEIFLKKINYKV